MISESENVFGAKTSMAAYGSERRTEHSRPLVAVDSADSDAELVGGLCNGEKVVAYAVIHLIDFRPDAVRPRSPESLIRPISTSSARRERRPDGLTGGHWKREAKIP